MNLAQRMSPRREHLNPSPTQRRIRRPKRIKRMMKRRKKMMKRKKKRRRKKRNPDHLLEPRLVPRKRTINPNPNPSLPRPPRRLTINQSLPRRTINPLQRKQTINPNLPVNPSLLRKMRRNQSRLERRKTPRRRTRQMINPNPQGNRNRPPRRMRINQSLLERRIVLVRSPSLLERERRMIKPREIRRRQRLRLFGSW
jgi:hypothetical protein